MEAVLPVASPQGMHKFHDLSQLILQEYFNTPLARFAVQFFVRKAWHNFRQHNIPLFLALQRDFMVNIIRKARHFVIGLQQVRHAMDPHYEPVFRRITAPTLLLWGSQDELFPVAAGERLHGLITGSRLDVVEGNHDWCLFDPERMYACLA